jgi:hypothetical protein
MSVSLSGDVPRQKNTARARALPSANQTGLGGGMTGALRVYDPLTMTVAAAMSRAYEPARPRRLKPAFTPPVPFYS